MKKRHLRTLVLLLALYIILREGCSYTTQHAVVGITQLPSSGLTQNQADTDAKGDVWICVSKHAYAYHRKKNCWGFKKCRHSTKFLQVEKAKQKGYKACGICY
ncbi:MAG: hypothetical protein AAFV25_17990 [Bacteroidota bacterium]